MKKKNCRMTDLERAQHARAVQFRKMTDAQICEYLDSLLEREREARSAAPAPSKEEIVNEFLDTLSIRTTSGLRVSDATFARFVASRSIAGSSRARRCRMADADREELRRYREEEERGLLLRLPVPLGAAVWRVRENPACHYGVRQAEIFLFGEVVTPRRIVEETPFTLRLLDEWGKSVFATEEEGRSHLNDES